MDSVAFEVEERLVHTSIATQSTSHDMSLGIVPVPELGKRRIGISHSIPLLLCVVLYSDLPFLVSVQLAPWEFELCSS